MMPSVMPGIMSGEGKGLRVALGDKSDINPPYHQRYGGIFYNLFGELYLFVTIQHPYYKVSLWLQNLTKSMLKLIKM
jgi:hypothetical protein